MNNLKKLGSISLIVSAEEVFVTDLKKTISREFYRMALENSRLISVYKIIYKSQGHNVVGYMVEPKKGRVLPCVIWNRGGFQEFGILEAGDFFVAAPARIALAGYLVVASQYSGNGGSEGKDEGGGGDLDDVLVLKKILDKYHRADVKRIGMCGGSRGGMMSLLALSKVKWIKALVLKAPLSDLEQGVKLRPEMKIWYKDMFGGSKKEIIKRSSIMWVNKLYKKAPILIMHGTSDWRVDVMQSLVLAQKLYQERVPYRLLVIEGGDHRFSNHRPLVMRNTMEWLDRYVKNLEPLPNLKLHGD